MKPMTCKVESEDCEDFIRGKSTRPIWQCTALDRNGKAWVSHANTKRDDAVVAAQAYCLKRSSVPKSCYVNVLTCDNLSEA